MNTFDSIWKKLGKSKRYREQFVADHAKRAIPHQARAILKARRWSQQKMAEQASLSQGVVSRAVDPSYGNLTLNTIIRLAAGFDVAFIGRFVPFSELATWYATLPEEKWDIPSFKKEDSQKAHGAPHEAAFMASGGQPSTSSGGVTFNTGETSIKKSVQREENFECVVSPYVRTPGNEIRQAG